MGTPESELTQLAVSRHLRYFEMPV